MDIKLLEGKLNELFEGVEIDGKEKNNRIKLSLSWLIDYISNHNLKEKLQILYDYEKHYFDLLKEYKEEIKFANSIQEDLRRERSQFFTQILKEASDTLEKAKVDSKIASKWIEELVNSYTKSINLSSDLAETQVVDIIGKLREETKNESNAAKPKGKNEEK